LGVVTTMLLMDSAAFAQNLQEDLGAEQRMPDVQPGAAAIYGQLRHPAGPSKTEGSAVILYSLAADGSPGVRTTAADGNGRFAFEALSGAAGITYLVGASYQSIPYGKRMAFEPGQTELTLVLEVDDPVSDKSRINVGDSSLRLEWNGASLGIEELHQLSNSGEAVVFVPPEMREATGPMFRARLPKGATQVDTSLIGIAEGYVVEDEELKFYGPVYAGGLELRFRYSVPTQREENTAGKDEMSLIWQLDSGSTRATLLYPATGPQLSVAGLSRGEDVVFEERLYHSILAGKAEPGTAIQASIALPAMSDDRSAISIPRTDYWLDADDTFLQVNVEINLVIAPGAQLAGTREDPLLTFELPDGSEFLGYAQQAQSIGLFRTADGDLGITGPLSPGNVNISFRYRMAVANEKPEIKLHFPMAVDVLNVLIADTGVAIETDRLHRRRPFRQGPRIYLHREAFSVEPGEVISIGLGLLDSGSLGRTSNLFATSLFAGLGAWFIVAPLVRVRRTSVVEFEQSRIRNERELVYHAIRDLEHDYETSKIEEAEYTTMRAELRDRGIALLKAARDFPEPVVETNEPAAAPVAAFCVACGTQLDAAWQFCAKCGAPTGTDTNVSDESSEAEPSQ
jgi:hypothetical protein